MEHDQSSTRQPSQIDPQQIESLDPEYAAVLRNKTVAERVAMVGSANRAARALIAAGVRRQQPDWTDDRVEAEVARRMLGGSA